MLHGRYGVKSNIVSEKVSLLLQVRRGHMNEIHVHFY